MDEADKGEARHDYEVTMYGAADEIAPQLIKGDIDVALVPCNLAGVLYNKTGGAVEVAAVNTLGVLYGRHHRRRHHQRGRFGGQNHLHHGQGDHAGVCAQLCADAEWPYPGRGRDHRIHERGHRGAGGDAGVQRAIPLPCCLSPM